MVLEGDSKVLIKPLQSSIGSLAQCGHITEDIKSTLPLFFLLVFNFHKYVDKVMSLHISYPDDLFYHYMLV